MGSKASELLPEPESPVKTTSSSRGRSRSMFLRLCSRAPRMEIIRVSAARLRGRLPFAPELSNRSFIHLFRLSPRKQGPELWAIYPAACGHPLTGEWAEGPASTVRTDDPNIVRTGRIRQRGS